MHKKWIFYSSLSFIITYLSSGFSPSALSHQSEVFTSKSQEMTYLLPSQNPSDYTQNQVPFTGKFFIGFKEAVAFKESQGQYHKVNTLGYMGKYQFGAETLASIGIHDSVAFLKNPKLQEKAFVALLSKNKWELQDEIQKFSGQVISGIKVTESGILAAAHLGGAGSVKRFLNSNGQRKCKDQYGTSVRSYMRDFAGYETSGIIADNNPKIK
ncbi:peptidoglycan-binding protein LysM [Flavobacterium sp. CYK-4]|nr:peptidoglycan-binding protein LysM [Flavobacterium lotistagni]